MTRVTWDVDGERVYQTGVDRGMLYVGSDIPLAIPWPGLINVTETRVLAGPNPFYLDGRRILNIPGGEEFAATIETFSAPLEFAPCAGRCRLSTGLFAADQPNKSFGFSYRTLIGNDLKGNNFAYRIHVIYNAMAQTSNFVHNTIADNRNPDLQSWAITASPVVVPGARPTAHFIFDTRSNSSDSINGIEAALYGSALGDPHLPSPAEIATLLAA